MDYMDDIYNDYMNEYSMMQRNQAVGVYTPTTQIALDPMMMQSLGFTAQEIQTLCFIVNNGGKVSPSALMGFGLDYESAKKLKYMYDIATGKVIIESPDDLVKHLRRMFGTHRRLGITDLALSKLQKVPRMAVVAGIKDKKFSIYNSSQYPIDERMYNVVDVTGGRIFIESNKKPVLKYKEPKKIDGVIEITELKLNGNVIVAVNKEYARLCNRFIIVGTLRRPEFHHGMIEIICVEGTKVYVYAQNLGTRETVKYNGGTMRIYDYGFMPKDIQPKLMKAASDLYPIICGVYATTVPANSDFCILAPEDREESIEDAIEE